MRTFLSKVLLTSFIFIFTFSSIGGIANATDIGGALGPGGGGQVVPVDPIDPPSTGQEYSWQPPAGAPLGNNTPSPVNTGPEGQRKPGPLNIGATFISESMLRSKGATFFEERESGGPSLFASFVPSTFLNNLSVGNPGTVGPTFNLLGKFKYNPATENGQPTTNAGLGLGGTLGGDGFDGQPEPGYVLTSIDNEGTAEWRPGLPNGGTDGNTLIWSETCNCWTTGPGGGTGTGLPPAEAGQTMWFNGDTGQWEATDWLKHFPQEPNSAIGSRTVIYNQEIGLIGQNRVDIGSLGGGLTSIFSPQTNINSINSINIGLDTGGETNIKSPTITFFEDAPGVTQSVFFRSNNLDFGSPTSGLQNIDIASNTVNFNNPAAFPPQAVTFNSSSVKFKGPISDPALVNPGLGRIPYSVDDEGTFRWNEKFTFENQEVNGVDIGLLNLRNPDNGFAVFQNDGLSSLLDDVVVGPEGQVYVQGLTSAYMAERQAGLVTPLCYVATTKRLVTCDSSVPGTAVPGRTPTLGGDITYTSNSSEQYHEFDFTGQAGVKYCAGGGGGGGGGMGSPDGNNETGQGANGGAGGGSGECEETVLNVTPGDRLTWSIGDGGNGGQGAWLNLVNGMDRYSTDGQPGQPTTIYFQDSGSSPNQVGPTVIGGNGGGGGRSPSQGAQTVAIHGTNSLAIGTYNWWFNGSSGRNEYGVSNTNPVDVDNTCVGCGGWGGNGEAYTVNGSLRTPDNSPMLPGQLSAGGRGGYDGPVPGAAQSYIRMGQPGGNGALSFGGGGGGGSHGKYRVNSNPYSLDIYGGQGGNGGGGYVTITGLPLPNTPDSIEFTVPGTYTFNAGSTVPQGVQNITVEVWGAGGGGGGVNLSDTTRSGGGGGGAYTRRTLTVSESNDAVTIIVGAGGNFGSSSNSAYTVSDGANGNLSRFGDITAYGGNGGQKASGTSLSVGAGGNGSSQTSGGSTSESGENGQSGNTGAISTSSPLAAGGRGYPYEAGQTYGTGGTGGRSIGPGDTLPTAGLAGKVKISW